MGSCKWGFKEVPLGEYERHTLFAISPDGGFVALGFQNGDIQVSHLHGVDRFETLKGHLSNVEAIVFSDERTLKSIAAGGTIRVWDTTTKTHVVTNIQDFVGSFPYGQFVLSPGGQMFAFLANAAASRGFMNEAFIYNATNGSLMKRLEALGYIEDCTFSKDGAKFCHSFSGWYRGVGYLQLPTFTDHESLFWCEFNQGFAR